MAYHGDLEVRAVLRDSFRLLLHRPFFCLIVTLAGFVLPGLILDLWIVGGSSIRGGPFDPVPDADWKRLYLWLSHQLLASLPILVFTLAMPDPETGQAPGNTVLLDQTFRKLPVTGMIAAFATGLIILGFLLLILPGIILGGLFSVAIPAAILENRTPLSALKRSIVLVRRAFWKTAAALLLVKALEVLVLQLVLNPRHIFGLSDTMDVGPAAWGWIGTGIIGMVGFLLPITLYHHLIRVGSGTIPVEGGHDV